MENINQSETSINLTMKGQGLLTDKYKVLRRLGKGGYAKVYEIQDKTTGEIFACKHLSKLNIENLEKFQREINILQQIDHPNIIKLFEIYETSHSLYLVMEECKGGELFDKIIEHINQKQMYSEADAAQILLQIMSAIEYCHNHGIVHRDLKPENLLYLNKGDEKNNPLKIIDFGLSRVVEREKKLKSKVGTAYYVAPEILFGVYNEKCDIWSAGVILYILLSGDPPFNGPSDNIIYAKIEKMIFDFPEKKWQNISNDAKDLLCHMLCPENQRYTASEVLAHRWFKNAQNICNKNYQLNISFLKEYKENSLVKKIILLLIASRLNENEIKDLNVLFKEFDKDKDGQISYDELKAGLLKLNSKEITEKDINDTFQALDVNKTGKIGYTEFIAATLNKNLYLQEEKLYEAFSVFDTNHTGKIKKEQILNVLKQDNSGNMIVNDLIEKTNNTEDDEIDYKQFLQIMGYNTSHYK